MQEFYIGQIFEQEYPTEAFDWCNENNARIMEIEPEDDKRRFQIQSIPEPHAPTYEEQKEKRAAAYCVKKDPITCHIQSLRDEEQTEEIVAEINALIAERAEVVASIKERYPYPQGE